MPLPNRKRFFFYLLGFLMIEARLAFPLLGWLARFFVYEFIREIMTYLLLVWR